MPPIVAQYARIPTQMPGQNRDRAARYDARTPVVRDAAIIVAMIAHAKLTHPASRTIMPMAATGRPWPSSNLPAITTTTGTATMPARTENLSL